MQEYFKNWKVSRLSFLAQKSRERGYPLGCSRYDFVLFCTIVMFFVNAPSIAKTESLSLEIVGPRDILVGESPMLQLQVKNISNLAVEFVLERPWSWVHDHYPKISGHVIDTEGKQYDVGGPQYHCGKSCALATGDLHKLAPAEAFRFTICGQQLRHGRAASIASKVDKPSRFVGPNINLLNKPGKYLVAIDYDLRAPSEDSWGLRYENICTESAVRARLRNVPSICLKTGPFAIGVHAVTADMLARLVAWFYSSNYSHVDPRFKSDLKKLTWHVSDLRRIGDHVTFMAKLALNRKPYGLEDGRYYLQLFTGPYEGPVCRYSQSTVFNLVGPAKAREAAQESCSESDLVQLGLGN